MDNLTHSLFGVCLARTRLGRAFARPTPLFVVAANLPDIDVVARPIGGTAAYLVHHRGLTHSLLGVSATALLLFLAAEWVGRRLGARPPAEGGLGRLFSLWIVLLSHPLLDLLNVYGVRPFLPFDGRWYYGDLLFIVDPWCWLLLGATAALSVPPRGGRLAGFAAVLLLECAVVWTAGRERGPEGFAPLFTLWAAVLLGAWLLLGCHRRPGAVLRLGAVALVLYGTAAWQLRSEALETARAVHPERLLDGPVRAVTPLPAPADPRRWVVLLEGDRRVAWVPVQVGRPAGAVWDAERRLEHPAVRRAARTPEGRAWRLFARHPVARVRCGGEVCDVELSDARYFLADWCTLSVRVPAERTSE